MIERYIDAAGGRARELWDVWCADVGADYGYKAQEVSKMHLDAIVPQKFSKYLHRTVMPYIPARRDVPF